MLAAATNLLKLCLGIIYEYLFPLTLKFELHCFYRKGSGTAQRQQRSRASEFLEYARLIFLTLSCAVGKWPSPSFLSVIGEIAADQPATGGHVDPGVKPRRTTFPLDWRRRLSTQRLHRNDNPIRATVNFVS